MNKNVLAYFGFGMFGSGLLCFLQAGSQYDQPTLIMFGLFMLLISFGSILASLMGDKDE